MSAAEILAELPRLSPEEIAAIRRGLEKSTAMTEMPGTGVRPPGYDALFGCLADDADGTQMFPKRLWFR